MRFRPIELSSAAYIGRSVGCVRCRTAAQQRAITRRNATFGRTVGLFDNGLPAWGCLKCLLFIFLLAHLKSPLPRSQPATMQAPRLLQRHAARVHCSAINNVANVPSHARLMGNSAPAPAPAAADPAAQRSRRQRSSPPAPQPCPRARLAARPSWVAAAGGGAGGVAAAGVAPDYVLQLPGAAGAIHVFGVEHLERQPHIGGAAPRLNKLLAELASSGHCSSQPRPV